jgi:single-stranded DNA-binding protein
VKTKKPVELDEDPAVPERLRWGIGRILHGARYVAVKEAQGTSNAYKALNGFQLKYRKGEKPEDSIDDIVLTICQIMHARWLDKNMASESEMNLPIKFRIELQAPDNPQSTRPYMDWVWDPDDDSVSEEDHMRSLEHMVLRDLLDQSQQDKERDRIYIADMQDRFLRQCELNAEPLKQTGDQLQFANALMLQGMQALVNAAQLTYSYDNQKALEESKTARWKMVMENLGPFAQIAGAQAMAYFTNKLGGNTKIPRGAAPAQPAATADSPPQPPADSEEVFEAPGTSEPDDDEPDDEVEDDDFDRTNPVAALAETFGDSITVRQRKELRKILTPEQIGLIDSMAESDDDAQAVAYYGKLSEELGPLQLVQLGLQLDPDQRKLFEMLRTLVAKINEPDSEDVDPDDEEDPETDPDESEE